MPVIVQCPYCPNKVKLSATAVKATCPKCLKSFIPVPPEEAEKNSAKAGVMVGGGKPIPPIAQEKVEDLPEPESSMPEWVSPWGLASFVLATVALLSASVVGIRVLTLGLAALGLGVALLGIPATKEPTAKDRLWLTMGGLLSGLILLMTLFTPGLLNNRWPLDVAALRADPNKQVVVSRDQPLGEGRPLPADGGADAATEGIRQDELLICAESAKAGRLPDKGKATFVLVHFRLGNMSHDQIAFRGFDSDMHKPLLTDSAGRSYVFLEQRKRLPTRDGTFFDSKATPGGVDVPPLTVQDYLLVFESPDASFTASKFDVPAKLEVPASAWGRNGVCQFRIAAFFDARLPNSKK
jgi:hypothetical protein